MRWEDLPESQNVEDRRGEGGGGGGLAAVAADYPAVPAASGSARFWFSD